jgi:hypothetical protein
MILSKQKAENKKRHRRKNEGDSEEITDIEKTISDIVAEMKNVAAVITILKHFPI